MVRAGFTGVLPVTFLGLDSWAFASREVQVNVGGVQRGWLPYSRGGDDDDNDDDDDDDGGDDDMIDGGGGRNNEPESLDLIDHR